MYDTAAPDTFYDSSCVKRTVFGKPYNTVFMSTDSVYDPVSVKNIISSFLFA
jgi:hypothetical protein